MKKILIQYQIDIDFECTNQNTHSESNSLFGKWNKFALNIILFMTDGNRDGNNQVLLQYLLEIKNTNLDKIITVM